MRVNKLKCLFGIHEYTQDKVVYYDHTWMIMYIQICACCKRVRVEKKYTHEINFYELIETTRDTIVCKDEKGIELVFYRSGVYDGYC